MDPDKFLVDLESKPEVLGRLADHVGSDTRIGEVPVDIDRVLMVGMGSSTYAAGVAAARLRAAGVNAFAELASSDLLPVADARTLVVAVSASGESRETLDAVQSYLGTSPTVGMTNNIDSKLGRACDVVLDLRAEPEVGGVACRSYQHTLAWLLVLENHLLGKGKLPVDTVRRSADASNDLLDHRNESSGLS